MVHIAGRQPYPAGRFAIDVLKGVDKNQAVIIEPPEARIFWLLQRLSPRLIESLGKRYLRWANANIFVKTETRSDSKPTAAAQLTRLFRS